MAGAILDKGDLGGITLTIGTRFELIEDGTEGIHDIQVGFFVPATDVVGFTQFPSFKHTADGTAVIFNVEPVTDLLTITIDRQWFAVQCIEDAKRDELFREVVRPIVVGAVRCEYG